MIQQGPTLSVGTNSIILDVTLSTLGLKHVSPGVVTTFMGGVKRPWFCWSDQPVHIHYPVDGMVKWPELCRRFESSEWHEQHPDDPLVFIRAAILRRIEIGDFIQGKISRLTDCAPHGTVGVYETTNSKLVASLYALGVPHTVPEATTGRECKMRMQSARVMFTFPELHTLDIAEAARLWCDRDWYKRNPLHPIAITRWAMVNWDQTLDYVNKVLPFVHQEHDGVDFFKKPTMTPDGPRVILPDKLPE